MPRLSLALGRCNYNGYEFNHTTRTKAVRVTPVPDGSNRFTAYNVWRIELATWITATSTTDHLVRDACERLSHPGGILTYTGRGLGNPIVNTGAIRDVRWGPKPDPIGLEVMGTGNAVKLTWAVEFAVPCCPDAAYQFEGYELVYTVEHAPDDAGHVTRTIAGHLAVPMTRKSAADVTLSDSADYYRAILAPPLLRGFTRKFGPWRLSEDRSRLDFSIVDDELGGEPYPANVVEAEWREGVSSTAAGLVFWTNTIHASYRLRKGATGLDAAKAFFNRLALQLTFVRNEMIAQKVQEAIIPIGFTAENANRYGKPAASFSFTYTMNGCPLTSILGVTGLWTPLGNDTWEAWATSLLPTAFNPYGATRLRFTTADERLAGLCEPNGPRLTAGPLPVVNIPSAGSSVQTMATLNNLYKQTFPAPKPETSWLYYKNELWCEWDSGIVPVQRLPASPLKSVDDLMSGTADLFGRVIDGLTFGSTGRLPAAPGGPAGAPAGILDNVIVDAGTLRRTKASVFLYMRGYAVRAGFPIDAPRLLDVNGVDAVPAMRLDRGEGFGRGVELNGMVPLHYAGWNLRYYLPGLPTKPLPVPPNPLAGEFNPS